MRDLQEATSGGTRGDSARQAVPVPVVLVGLIFFLLAETAAAVRLMGLLGMQALDRLILGIALACILVALTAGLRDSILGRIRGWPAAGIVITYILFLFSTAVLRLSDLVVPASGAALSDWMSAVLLVLSAAGPAWLAEICLRDLRASAPERNLQRRAQTELRALDRGVMDARRSLSRLGNRTRQWDEEQAQLMALFDTTFMQEAAARNGNDTEYSQRRDDQ